MANPQIKLKRSSTQNKRPTPENVPLGELALNTYDGYLYASKDVGAGTTVITVNPWRVGTGTDSYNIDFTTGNVGINSASPTALLDVNGDVNITGVGTFTGLDVGTGGIDVDGHTELDDLNVSGVSTFTGNVSFGSTATFGDDDKLKFGDGEDLQIYHDGTDAYIDYGVFSDNGGDLIITNYFRQGDIVFKADPGTGLNPTTYIKMDGSNNGVFLYYAGSQKFKTRGGGVTITGDIDATSFDGNLTGFDELTAPHSSTTKTYSVTVSSKSDHR